MRLVFGYDGSDSSKNALALVRKHAADINAKIYIITSLAGEHSLQAKAEKIAKGVDAVKEAEALLEFAQHALTKDGIVCETHLLIRGLGPAEDIVRFARDVDADFIVVGAGKPSRTGKKNTSATTQQVILDAPCAVVTTK
jgi:nucleotide-binding universal stress UspA family protein